MDARNLRLFATIFSLSTTAFFFTPTFAAYIDTITSHQTVTDGQTVISANGFFELGFFSPGSSKNRYLGIWYKKVSTGTAVWVANRDTPLVANTSGTNGSMLKFSSAGSLVLVDAERGSTIWSSSSNLSLSSAGSTNPVARLLDTGNLVILDGDGTVIWQSFDHPGDTLLPGMKLGKDLATGKETHLTSWRSADDPSPGSYTLGMDVNGYPQLYLSYGSLPVWRMFRYVHPDSITSSRAYKQEFVANAAEAYYTYNQLDPSFGASRMVLTSDGNFTFLNWPFVDRHRKHWNFVLTAIADTCDKYAVCGAYMSCSLGICECWEGFEKIIRGGGGCKRKIPLECGSYNSNGIKFQSNKVGKLPDTSQSWYNKNMSQPDCELACRNNCSCTAYSYPYYGCLLWFGELIDIKQDPKHITDLYVKLSVLPVWMEGLKHEGLIIRVTLATTSAMVLLGLVLIFAWITTRKRRQLKTKGREGIPLSHAILGRKEDLELPRFSKYEITKATNNFSIDNKLGQGGFAPVYKGVLEGGQEIAVKRFSKTSRQGLDEIKNEVICIANLQHRNLVKLIGYCTQGDEVMMIYEYVPNKSLDAHIFGSADEAKRPLLNWHQRIRIIHGIARGLQYLHQDSRHRIIHRDLKAGNILLDSDMDPKISNFGLARMLEGQDVGADTERAVGAYGYISPEQALHGMFSIKSDVFSFGVLVLEIVSGKKNRGFSSQEDYDNLLGHAWRLYREGRSLDLIDPPLRDSRIASEALRTIHVGLLCVQQRAEDRPTMPDVVLMLGVEDELPKPKPPAFFIVADPIASASEQIFEERLKLKSY